VVVKAQQKERVKIETPTTAAKFQSSVVGGTVRDLPRASSVR
jgi:hypothetical protein